MFGEVLERKEALRHYKNIDLKKAQNLRFSKGVSPWFLSKSGDFINVLFLCKINKKKCINVVDRK